VVLRRKSISGSLTTFAGVGVAGTLLGIVAKVVWDGLVDRAASSAEWVTVVLAVAVMTLITMVVLVSRKVDHLIEKANFSITYYPADDPGELYGRSRNVIREADSQVEIYAVNSYVEVFQKSDASTDTAAEKKAQHEYLKQFEKKFDTMKYHRLIQVQNGQLDSGQPGLASLLAPAYRDHYRHMAQFAEEHPGKRIKIEKVPAKLPTSFVVVKDKNGDGGRIIWQMNMHDPTAGSPEFERIMGVFIITDPDALLVPRFMQWFDELDRSSRELTSAELRDQGTTDEQS
jgi:hypothetical protein